MMYEVLYEPLETFNGNIAEQAVNTTNRFINLMGLEEFINYRISVRGYTIVGPGNYSVPVIVKTLEDVPAIAPVNVQSQVLFSTSINVSWEEIPLIRRNGIVILYEVLYEPQETFGGAIRPETVNTTNIYYVLIGLQEYVDYDIFVRASTRVGFGPYSQQITNQTFQDTPGSPPEDVNSEVLTSTSIVVSWGEIPAIDQNGIIITYEILFEQLETFGDLIVEEQYNSTDLSLVITDLQPFVNYSISVRAYTIVGPGNYSSAIIRMTDGFSTQLVDVITAEGISTAGFSGYTLICNTSKASNFLPTSTLAVEWLSPSDNIINNGTNFTITGVGPTTSVVLTSRLTFNNLFTSQAGLYTCRTLQTLPGIVTNHPVPVTFLVQTKLPTPLSPPIFHLSRNSTLNAGTSFSLTCIVHVNTTGVDSNFTVQSSITGPGISDTSRVHVSHPTLVTGSIFNPTVTFSYLLEADSGVYSCSAFIASSHSNVIASDSIFGSESLNVEPLQIPSVSLSAVPVLIAGDEHIVVCTVTVDEYLVATPILEWIFPDSITSVSTSPQSTNGIVFNITLIFDEVRTSQGGIYGCRVAINITGFDLLSQTINETVRVQIPPPLAAVLNPPTIPYNGTIFTLTGVVQLDPNVDTAVTASGMWSDGGSSIQESTSPPYQFSLRFHPLATNSSGVYTLTVSVRPSDNSPYIIGNNRSTSYSLVVRPLPSHPPTIFVVSRHQSSDECGEVMTLNCTANQVENLITPPIITWIAPDSSEVPTLREGSTTRVAVVNPQTKQLIFTDLMASSRGAYTCRAIINISEAQIDNHFDETSIEVNTALPGVVQNLECSDENSSPFELAFSWELPRELGNEVIGYQVMVNRLEQRRGTREVFQSGVYNNFTETSGASISGLASEVPYNITVKAINLAGCGEEKQLYCFTQEGVPPPPENVVVVRFDSTSIGVSWTKYTLVELKGLANYIVTYNIIIGSRRRQTGLGGTITVPWTQNRVIVSDLQPGADYDVTVSTFTIAGMSDPVGPGSNTASDSMITPPPASSNSDNTVAIIGGMVAILIVLIIAATIVVVIALIFRNQRAEFKPNRTPLPQEQPGGIILSNLSPISNASEEYETIAEDSTDHDYEMLDKYNQEIQAPTPPEPVQQQPQSTPGGYELTQCPAYVPVATTGIYVNTS